MRCEDLGRRNNVTARLIVYGQPSRSRLKWYLIPNVSHYFGCFALTKKRKSEPRWPSLVIPPLPGRTHLHEQLLSFYNQLAIQTFIGFSFVLMKQSGQHNIPVYNNIVGSTIYIYLYRRVDVYIFVKIGTYDTVHLVVEELIVLCQDINAYT